MVRYIRGTWSAYQEMQEIWAAHWPSCASCEGASNPCDFGRVLRSNSQYAYERHYLRGTRDTSQGAEFAAALRDQRRMMARWSAQHLREEIKTYEYLTSDERVKLLRGPLGREFVKSDVRHLRMLKNALRFRELDGGGRRVWRCDFCGKNNVPISGSTSILRCGECAHR